MYDSFSCLLNIEKMLIIKDHREKITLDHLLELWLEEYKMKNNFKELYHREE